MALRYPPIEFPAPSPSTPSTPCSPPSPTSRRSSSSSEDSLSTPRSSRCLDCLDVDIRTHQPTWIHDRLQSSLRFVEKVSCRVKHTAQKSRLVQAGWYMIWLSEQVMPTRAIACGCLPTHTITQLATQAKNALQQSVGTADWLLLSCDRLMANTCHQPLADNEWFHETALILLHDRLPLSKPLCPKGDGCVGCVSSYYQALVTQFLALPKDLHGHVSSRSLFKAISNELHTVWRPYLTASAHQLHHRSLQRLYRLQLSQQVVRFDELEHLSQAWQQHRRDLNEFHFPGKALYNQAVDMYTEQKWKYADFNDFLKDLQEALGCAWSPKLTDHVRALWQNMRGRDRLTSVLLASLAFGLSRVWRVLKPTQVVVWPSSRSCVLCQLPMNMRCAGAGTDTPTHNSSNASTPTSTHSKSTTGLPASPQLLSTHVTCLLTSVKHRIGEVVGEVKSFAGSAGTPFGDLALGKSTSSLSAHDGPRLVTVTAVEEELLRNYRWECQQKTRLSLIHI